MENLENTVVELFKEAVINLPKDVEKALKKAENIEENQLSKNTLNAILENIDIAKNKNLPMCQDTGVPIIFLKIGKNINSSEIINIIESIKKGVEKATKEIPLRPNVVHPLTRENFKTNCGLGAPFINIDFTEKLDKEIEITVFPKGAGSENMSSLKMLTPSEGINGIKKYVLETIAEAGGKPCPPIIVGVGIGGTADLSLKLAKKALLRQIGQRNKDENIANLEKELLDKINKLGIGTMGLGGNTTALDLFIEINGCHTASLPIGICIQCWAGRSASKIIKL